MQSFCVKVFIRVIGSISGRFKIGFCVDIDFYIILNSFWSWVESGSVSMSGNIGSLGPLILWCKIEFNSLLINWSTQLKTIAANESLNSFNYLWIRNLNLPSVCNVSAEYCLRDTAFSKQTSTSFQCERPEYKFAKPSQTSNSFTLSSSAYQYAKESL